MRIIMLFAGTMLPYMAIALPAAVLWRVTIAHTLLRRRGLRTTAWHECGIMLFVMFLVGLGVSLGFSPITAHGGNIYVNRRIFTGTPQFNFVPANVFVVAYRELERGGLYTLLIGLLGNIVMFMPIGLCAVLLYRDVSVRRATAIGLLSSLSIEILQMPVVGRWTDIDDLILNTLGVWCGAMAARAISAHAPAFAARCKVITTAKHRTD